MNRAINGDVVAVELTSASDDIFFEYVTMGDDDPLAQMEDARAALGAVRRSQKLSEKLNLRYGRIVGIMSRPRRRY